MKQEQDKQEEENKDRKRPVPVDISHIGNLKKNKLLQPIYSQDFATKQQESKVSSEWLKSSISRFDSHSTTFQAFTKQDMSPHFPPFFTPSQANFSASELNLACNKLTTKNDNLDNFPQRPCHSGYSRPSTITSQEYQREQEQERKPKIEMFDEKHSHNVNKMKKEPSLLDDVVYEGSMTSNGMYVNPYTNIPRQNTTRPDMARYHNRSTLTEQARTNHRPSVIRNSNTAKDQEQQFLQMEANMLKMHGDLLTQTGTYFQL